jgi:ubiquinone/menaquinone biosynthesis C-methylase UbiE
MSFDDHSFDKTYAVSSIEHIPNQGDTQSVKEMMRVTKEGGFVVITVPFSPEYLEQQTTDYYQGFERRYDAKNLKKRLIDPSGAKKFETYFLNNKFGGQDEFHNIWYKENLDAVVSDKSWDFTKALFTISKEPTILSRGAIIKLFKN